MNPVTTWNEDNVKDEISNEPKEMLPKRTHVWECKVNEETTLYEHSNKSNEISTLNNNDEMRNHLLSYDVLILEVSFHGVWVERNGTLYLAPID